MRQLNDFRWVWFAIAVCGFLHSTGSTWQPRKNWRSFGWCGGMYRRYPITIINFQHLYLHPFTFFVRDDHRNHIPLMMFLWAFGGFLQSYVLVWHFWVLVCFWFVNGSSTVRQSAHGSSTVRQFVNGSSIYHQVRQWGSSIVRQSPIHVRQYWRTFPSLTNRWRTNPCIDEPLTNWRTVDELLTNYSLHSNIEQCKSSCWIYFPMFAWFLQINLQPFYTTRQPVKTTAYLGVLVCSGQKLRQTMDELIPLIVCNDRKLERETWCYTHKKMCRRGTDSKSTDANSDILNLLLLGSPCVVPRMKSDIEFFCLGIFSILNAWLWQINMYHVQPSFQSFWGLLFVGSSTGLRREECESIPHYVTWPSTSITGFSSQQIAHRLKPFP